MLKRTLILSISFLTVALTGIIFFIEKQPAKKLSGAYEALNYWTRMRAYPDKDISPEKFYIAFQKQKVNVLQKTAAVDCGALMMQRPEATGTG